MNTRSRTDLQHAVSQRNWRKGRLVYLLSILQSLQVELKDKDEDGLAIHIKERLTRYIEARYVAERNEAIKKKERDSIPK